jgi:mannose-6-phosphate isomerase-like protein (cupin superfamily)
MAKHIFVALTNPVPGKEAEFNKFYDEVHVPDVLGAPGWVAAQRYRLTSEQRPDQSPPYRYAAIYEVECEDGEILAPLKQRPDVGPIGRPNPPLWDAKNEVWIFTEVGPRHVAGKKPAADAETRPAQDISGSAPAPIDHHYERGWRRYGFDNVPFTNRAIHGSSIPIAVRNIFNRGTGKAHISFGILEPTEDAAIGMHIHRDVPTNTDVEEWYVIVEGEGEMTFTNGDIERCGPGDLVAIYPGTGHSFRATGQKPLRLISITPEMYTTRNPVTPFPDAFAPAIVVGEVDEAMNPFDATCSRCGATWHRPTGDRSASSLAKWARTHACVPAREDAAT